MKYIWHSMHMQWNPEQKAVFSTHLQSTNTTGLTINAIHAEYLMQHSNSLIGRQFKQLAQTGVFHLADLVPLPLFSLWKAVGALFSLLWMPEIDDMDTYLVWLHRDQWLCNKLLTLPMIQRWMSISVLTTYSIFLEKWMHLAC